MRWDRVKRRQEEKLSPEKLGVVHLDSCQRRNLGEQRQEGMIWLDFECSHSSQPEAKDKRCRSLRVTFGRTKEWVYVVSLK